MGAPGLSSERPRPGCRVAASAQPYGAQQISVCCLPCNLVPLRPAGFVGVTDEEVRQAAHLARGNFR